MKITTARISVSPDQLDRIREGWKGRDFDYEHVEILDAVKGFDLTLNLPIRSRTETNISIPSKLVPIRKGNYFDLKLKCNVIKPLAMSLTVGFIVGSVMYLTRNYLLTALMTTTVCSIILSLVFYYDLLKTSLNFLEALKKKNA